MAVTSFIPEIWNAQLLTDFREQAVAAALTNREYEGNASSGNVVKINTAVAVQVKDYKANSRTTSADSVSTTSQDLLIDQEKNFDFYVDDIDKAQAAGSMDAFTRSAGEGMAEDSDKFILSTAVTGAGTALDSGGVALDDPEAAFNAIRDMRKALRKALVPGGQWVLLVNAEFEAVLLGASSKLTSVDTSGSPAGLRNASLGRLLNFDIYSTENLPTTAKAQAVALYRPSLAYVSQVEKTEALRAQDKFADRLRGLHVYGGKVIRPEGIVTWTDTSA
ncbi:hypothetical protein ACFYMO_00875 [Streptomyces sp. NPDC007025]|uniref:hypothetical protein n=1 Tax=Streptomyces sp. NPDC007025 TaxID=3364771 RepID=UPI0036CB33D0